MWRQALPAAPSRDMPAWSHDAEPTGYPLGTWLLQTGVDLWIRCGYRRIVVSPHSFRIDPGTLLASNHQRDVDGPMLGVTLLQRRGLRFHGTPPWYATREDLFRPGILARLTVRWPAPLSALLGLVSLAWFFPLGRTEPMRRVPEFTLAESLQALCDAGCGGNACGALLNERGLRELDVREPTLPLRALLARRDPPLENAWGLRRLRRESRRLLAPSIRATIAAQIEHFARRLDRGCCVYFSPEGTLSLDGHFGRVRAGFFRVARATARPPWVQPLALAYDTLGFGRPRVVIRFGDRFRADTRLDRRSFDATLRDAVLDLVPVTPSHLLARWLAHGPGRFTVAQLAAWLAGCTDSLQAHHASVDPLLAADGIALVRERLRWLELKRLVVREDGCFRNVMARDAVPGWHAPASAVRYLDHQLADIAPRLGRIAPC